MSLAPGEIGTPPTVLIVSDNPKLIGMLSRFLSRQGMVTLSADSGPQCLEKVLHQGAIDVIVLEMMMAGMNGFEVCVALKEIVSACAIPIVLLTDSDDLDTHLAAMRLGVSEFMLKPVRIRDFLAHVQIHVECSRKAREMERVLTCGVLEAATPYQYFIESEKGGKKGKAL
jgi:DNA-binding response OmpR family regulator